MVKNERYQNTGPLVVNQRITILILFYCDLFVELKSL